MVQGQKQGGNVASYFCTPGGRVLHVVTGPATAEVLLREARWAVETYKLAQLETGGDETKLLAFYRKVHSIRLLKDHGYDIRASAKQSTRPTLSGQGLVHRALAHQPLVKIESVYKYIFEKVLNEKVSIDPVEVVN